MRLECFEKFVSSVSDLCDLATTLLDEDVPLGIGSNYVGFFPPPQGVSFTFRMGTLPLLSITDEITEGVGRN